MAMFSRPSLLSMPPAFVRDGLASQTSTAHTLLHWHYRIPRMYVLIGHVCGVEQTTEWLNSLCEVMMS